MKGLKLNWKLLNLPERPVIILIKNFQVFREDEEHQIPVEEDIKVVWNQQYRVSAYLEVYPDYESFTRRVFPMDSFSYKFPIEEKEFFSSIDYFNLIIGRLNKETAFRGQNFSKGEIIEMA